MRYGRSFRIRSFSGSYFPAFRLNTERYSVFLRIHSECVKIRNRKTLNTDTFHALYNITLAMSSGSFQRTHLSLNLLKRGQKFPCIQRDLSELHRRIENPVKHLCWSFIDRHPS